MWYFQEEGRPLGRLTEGQVRSFLLRGTRGANDLLWSDSVKQWKMVRDWFEFRAFPFPADQGLDPEEGGEPQWVLLKWPQKVVEGPYTKSQLRELANQGILQATHYVWKPGLSAWCKLSDRADLNELFP